MSSLFRILPNILTSSRIFLTYIFVSLQNKQHYDIKNSGVYLSLLIVFLFICVTDLLDGKVARTLKSESSIGGFCDVIADAIFIFSAFITLNIHDIIPIWFTIVILIKFLEFIITSYLWRKLNTETEELFMSDFIGRLVAVLFYIIPGIIYLLLYNIEYTQLSIINVLIYITTILALISSIIRCLNCFMKLNNTR